MGYCFWFTEGLPYGLAVTPVPPAFYLMEHLAWSPALSEGRETVLNINKEPYLDMCPAWSKTSENTGTSQCLASWAHPSGLSKPHSLPCRSCQVEGSRDGYGQGLQMPLTPPSSALPPSLTLAPSRRPQPEQASATHSCIFLIELVPSQTSAPPAFPRCQQWEGPPYLECHVRQWLLVAVGYEWQPPFSCYPSKAALSCVCIWLGWAVVDSYYNS